MQVFHPSSASLVQLIYASSATSVFTESALEPLLKQSRDNNAAHGISGILLYYEGSFLQVIEGEALEVEHLINVIKSDVRHHSFLQLLRRSIETREFPEWSMAFRDVTKSRETLEGFSDFLQKGKPNPFHGDASRAKMLLLAFKKVCNLTADPFPRAVAS